MYSLRLGATLVKSLGLVSLNLLIILIPRLHSWLGNESDYILKSLRECLKLCILNSNPNSCLKVSSWQTANLMIL